VLSQAEELARDGRCLDAIAALTAVNRTRRSPEIEERLVRLRHEAYAEIDTTGGAASWPPDAPDLFGDISGLPEISARELDADTLRSGIIRHGALVVRGLLAEPHIGALIDDIDQAFSAFDAFASGAPVSETAPWFVPFAPGGGVSVAPVRRWVRGSGGVLAVESPRAAFDVLETFGELGLTEVLAEYLGERPVLSAKKWTLRRVPIDTSTNWHQDGAFLGHDLRVVNLWMTLSRCGEDAPGLDVVPRRLDEILPTGTEGAIFDVSIGPPVVARAAETAPVQRPIFEAGDALLFDEMFLHRTAVSGVMRHERYAIESWFFAPSHYPEKHIPVAV
jgi:hypothetical protein